MIQPLAQSLSSSNVTLHFSLKILYNNSGLINLYHINIFSSIQSSGNRFYCVYNTCTIYYAYLKKTKNMKSFTIVHFMKIDPYTLSKLVKTFCRSKISKFFYLTEHKAVLIFCQQVWSIHLIMSSTIYII